MKQNKTKENQGSKRASDKDAFLFCHISIKPGVRINGRGSNENLLGNKSENIGLLSGGLFCLAAGSIFP
jgi:hypothetical protein